MIDNANFNGVTLNDAQKDSVKDYLISTFDSSIYLGQDNISIAFSAEIENAIGGDGNDTITGNDLDNVLEGGKGNDLIDGSGGSNTAVYSGNMSDYSIDYDGSFIITDNVGQDGTDTLSNIQHIQFADVTYDTSMDIAYNNSDNSIVRTEKANVSLFKTTSGGYVIADTNGTLDGSSSTDPILLMKGTKPWTAFKGDPLGLIDYGFSGFGVVSKNGSKWVEQKFYNNGNASTSTSLTLAEVLALEANFGLDLNQDGDIGDPVDGVLATGNAKGLYKTLSGEYVLDINTLDKGHDLSTPTILTDSTGKAFTKWKGDIKGILEYSADGSIGVFTVSTGNQLTSSIMSALGVQTDAKWVEQRFNSDGSAGESIKLELVQVLNLEAIHDVDLTGGNIIGDSVYTPALTNLSSDTDGLAVYKTKAGGYVIADEDGKLDGSSDLTPILLLKGTKPFTGFKGDPKGLVDNGDGSFSIYSVSGSKWTEEVFDANGVAGDRTSLTLAELLNKEASTGLDLNQDGNIGATISSAIDDVTNFDVTSDIILTAETVGDVVKGSGNISIVNDGGTGLHGEAASNSFVIDVTTDAVTVSGKFIQISLPDHLDFNNNYHIEIDAGAFTDSEGSVDTAGISDSTTINFSTVDPGAFDNASTSVNMIDSNEMAASFNWIEAEGNGDPATQSAATIDVDDGDYVFVATDYGVSDGDILSADFLIEISNFASGDGIYWDDLGNGWDKNDTFDALFTDVNQTDELTLTVTGKTGATEGKFIIGTKDAYSDTTVTSLAEFQTFLDTNYEPIFYG